MIVNKALSPLEKLLEEYMIGLISFETYRSERSSLIERLTQDELQRDVTIPKSSNIPNATPSTEIDNNSKTYFQIPTIQKDNSISASKKLQYLIVILLLVGGGLSWYLSNDLSEPNTSTQSPTNIEPQSDTTNDFNEPFIIAFNEKTDWNTEVMSNFLVQWQSLTSTQKNMARQSTSFVKLGQILRKRIEQQRMISNNKEKKVTRRESLLIWFASQLSISVN